VKYQSDFLTENTHYHKHEYLMALMTPAQRHTFFSAMLLLLILLFSLVLQQSAQADIYRFVTIDGIENFTDSPQQKDAQIVIKESAKPQRKKSAQIMSSESKRSPAPSLKEIIEKTVQSQINPENVTKSTIDASLPVNGIITSGVGMRVDPIDGHWRQHNGIDIAVPEGTLVRAVASGIVVYAGLRSGYGWTVLVEHDNGMITLCGHNSKIIVENGQAVKQGEVIALSGNTGRSTGPHVHFEAWQSGNNITPAFMPGSTVKLASSSNVQRQQVHFHKEVLADGSILITNIPSSIP
jgi:murein DD-endopeptidase MepM/ murein hydrolase activator NlpD